MLLLLWPQGSAQSFGSQGKARSFRGTSWAYKTLTEIEEEKRAKEAKRLAKKAKRKVKQQITKGILDTEVIRAEVEAALARDKVNLPGEAIVGLAEEAVLALQMEIDRLGREIEAEEERVIEMILFAII